MPRFLERALKQKYGSNSSIPYKIMNKLGFMQGPHETPKGRRAEVEHAKKVQKTK